MNKVCSYGLLFLHPLLSLYLRRKNQIFFFLRWVCSVQRIRYLGLLLALGLFFGAGWRIAQSSWNGALYIYVDSSPADGSIRNIASVGEEENVSLSKDLRSKGLQKTMVHLSQVKSTEKEIEFFLGPALLKGQGGLPVLACKSYQKVDMLFVAGEVAFHGHSPVLSMQADCRVETHNNVPLTGPFVIPRKQIVSAPVDQKLFRSKKGDLFLFSHVQIRWPKKWTLSQIRFFSDKKGEKDFVLPFSAQKEEDLFTLHFF